MKHRNTKIDRQTFKVKSYDALEICPSIYTAALSTKSTKNESNILGVNTVSVLNFF